MQINYIGANQSSLLSSVANNKKTQAKQNLGFGIKLECEPCKEISNGMIEKTKDYLQSWTTPLNKDHTVKVSFLPSDTFDFKYLIPGFENPIAQKTVHGGNVASNSSTGLLEHISNLFNKLPNNEVMEFIEKHRDKSVK